MTKLRRILLSVLCTFTLVFGVAHGADTPGMSPMVNLRYIHNLIEHEWGINIPIVSEHPSAPANMRYLFAVIDAANSKVGTKTDYQHSEYATGFAANVNTSIKAVRTLIKPKYHFTATTTSDTTTFSFTISASGTFYVNWGDGTAEQKITKSSTGSQTISHTYATAGAYDIRIGGRATGYDSNLDGPGAAISFGGNTELAGISGSLGRIFPNIGTSMPSFISTFADCGGLTGGIPSELFAGISGAPALGMFYGTFSGSSGLTGEIPTGLFAGISGAPAGYMFGATFAGCSGLTGEIPTGLFAGISGTPAGNMFDATFYGCSGLTGEIPMGLFAGINGAPAESMFYSTFAGCSGLTGEIPTGLFVGISGAPAGYMFYSTFAGCSGLTGEIPTGLFAGINGAPAEGMFYSTFADCSGLTGSIPDGLFGNISGAPMHRMFAGTFGACSGLTGEIPLGVFGNLSGTPATDMFYQAFTNCSKLTGPSARNPDGTPLYTVFPTATTAQVGGMYNGATGLSDYADIPAAWK